MNVKLLNVIKKVLIEILFWLLLLMFVKFILFPLSALIFNMDRVPLFTVASGSMEHNNYEKNWEAFYRGINTGDMIVVYGTPYEELKVGDVIVFQANRLQPIIHRIVNIDSELITTQGDANSYSFDFEKDITKDRYIGKVVARIPFIGHIKLALVNMYKAVKNGEQ